MTRERTRIAALAAVAALVLVGCGGEDTADDVGGAVTAELEREELGTAAAEAQAEVEGLYAQLRDVRSTDEAAGAMESAAAELRTSATDVRDADPGTDEPGVADAQAALADAVERLAGELDEAAPRVREGNVIEAVREAQALEAVDDVARALEDLEREGVEVPQLDGVDGG